MELSAYFQMQININVNVLTKVETITSNSILFSNFNDYLLLRDPKQHLNNYEDV